MPKAVRHDNVLKALKTTERHYYKVAEYTSAGSYSLTIPVDTTARIILVGGGGGAACARYAASATQCGANGGSAGMITGATDISTGTYSVTVGEGGMGQWTYSKNQYVAAVANGTAGTATTFLGNTAGAGGGAYARAAYNTKSTTNGSAGTTTIVSTGLTGSDGSYGSTTSRYGSYGGGGVSQGDQTGVQAQGGYARIEFESDETDYTYYVDVNIFYGVTKQ